MDLWEALVVMVRRWHVTLPLLILTAVGVVLVGSRVEPTYSASGALIFVGPNQVEIGEDGAQVLEPTNPFLRFNGSIQTTARAIVLAVSSGSTAAELVAEGLSSDYVVGVENRNPIITVDVSGDDQEVTLATLERLIQIIRADLSTRQEAFEAPPEQRIGLQVLSQPQEAEASYGSRNRLRIVVAVLGITLAVGGAFAVEGLSRLLSQRSSPRRNRWAGAVKRPSTPSTDTEAVTLAAPGREASSDPDVDPAPGTDRDGEGSILSRPGG